MTARWRKDLERLQELVEPAAPPDVTIDQLRDLQVRLLSGNAATIKVAQEVPFVTGQYASTGGTGNTVNPFTTVQREEVGTILKITPQITGDNTVLLKIEQEVSSLAANSRATGAVDLITNKRTINTNVLVDDGGLIVLGGLMSDQLTDSEQRVPGLGSIPLLGNLFKVRSSQKTKTNLLVFIRPKIIRTAEQAAIDQPTGIRQAVALGLGHLRARGHTAPALMLNGDKNPAEIIASVKNGIYCTNFTNGQVNIGAGDFTFYVKNGWLIEDGKLTRPGLGINILSTPKGLMTGRAATQAGVGGEIGATNENFMFTSLFQLSDCFWIKVSLNLRLASGDSLQCLGVHDFVGCLPYLCIVAREWRISG